MSISKRRFPINPAKNYRVDSGSKGLKRKRRGAAGNRREAPGATAADEVVSAAGLAKPPPVVIWSMRYNGFEVEMLYGKIHPRRLSPR